MIRRKTSSLPDEPTINLTPLIDVVFVILIMFIVVAPLLELERVNLAESSSEQAQPVSQKSQLTIHVKADNTILINQIPAPIKELSSLLSQEKQRNPTMIPQLYHDRNATFGTYQAVKNAVEKAGFSQMDVLLKPES